tara:strand:+ start:891 stop:2963 length:2073 start_codon:yes stop_codon:yes gene_type:complete
MKFRIADTFTDSLAKLTGQEQKSVKTTAFDLQINPASPGLKFHKLDRAKDPNFWSVRVSRDIRLIVHKSESNLLLCFVDHHDKAYSWAERRKVETHPTTGAAQLVEIRETVKEITIPMYVEEEQAAPPKKLLFADISDEDLLSYGVPTDWLADVRVANEDTVLNLVEHLPSEAAEFLLELATGGTLKKPVAVSADTTPFDHPDAQRRFRVMHDIEELERALEFPWEKWAIFLHPAQRQVVEQEFSGPARVSGSAGTGKTIVALHRAVFLARSNPDARILLTTFSGTLADALTTKLRRLINNEPRIGERLEVLALDAIARRLYAPITGKNKVASRELIQEIIQKVTSETPDLRFTQSLLLNEWEQVVDAWQLDSWDSYRDVVRLGRKTRLPEKQRKVLWSIFKRVREELNSDSYITEADLFSRLADQISDSKHPPFDYVVVDEAQDVSVAQLRFLAAMGENRPNSLFFSGDLGQRIFQQPFSWKALGVDIRGRSKTLHINYRTSHQIRSRADRLLDPSISDVDGNIEDRGGTISVFNGANPSVIVFESDGKEIEGVGQWLQGRLNDGVLPHEIGVFVRSQGQVERATNAVQAANVDYSLLDNRAVTSIGKISISTMHLAKGLEFRSVAVMACDDEVIPLQSRIETVVDDTDLEEIYKTERHLLYVACTRARDDLFVSGASPASEFLDDIVD